MENFKYKSMISELFVKNKKIRKSVIIINGIETMNFK